LIMLIMMSSLTSPPWSMIFLASLPRLVFFATWARSMSPVALRPVNRGSQIQSAQFTYQMTDAVFVLDLRGLCTLSWTMCEHHSDHATRNATHLHLEDRSRSSASTAPLTEASFHQIRNATPSGVLEPPACGQGPSGQRPSFP
jgi:hypothetical protein